jgi:predicted MPP superfamily phosphohydrolase
VVARLPAEGAAVLLAHEPDFADRSARSGRFDLQLSGHSHGGQVRLFNQPLLPVPHGMKYRSGLYRVGKMIQYTNRGLGMGFPPVRINCRPEITVLTLRAGENL